MEKTPMPSSRPAVAALAALTLLFATAGVVHADGNLGNVNHVIIVMMENHSFDNYFGVLPYATGAPSHGGPRPPSDHSCVDGLTCTRDMSRNYSCSNSNLDDDASLAYAFHDPRYCTGPDLQHNWQGSHQEANYSSPAGALLFSPNDGFVLVNDAQEQIDSGETLTDDDTIGFYNEDDLPFYYGIAQTFAMNDRYFCSFVDPILVGPTENDEHPPTDIRAGEFFVWQVINAVRNGPNWSDSVIFFTYDEHGGFYDHVAPPQAPQGGALNPDGINPGQCADLSNPPASQQPGGGVQCSVSQSDAAAICPGFTPTGPYPAACANFNQLGFRVPFVAVSPFSKPQYGSHTIGEHSSML